MLGSKIVSFQTLASTNTYLKDNYRNFTHGTIVTCVHQTEGKGRFNRNWFAGEDLLLSILIKENLKLTEIPQLGLVCAAAVYETLKKYVSDLIIKWPNVILVRGKKLAGILLESVIGENRRNCLIIGIGINVNTVNYPKELAHKSTSLKLQTGNSYVIDELQKKLIENINVFYLEFKLDNHRYIDICIMNSGLIGKDVVFNNFSSVKKGKVLAILRNGNILIEADGIATEYNYGEITLSEY